MYSGVKQSNRTGFTLIEVLISMVIFSIVIALAVMSYRFSLQNLTSSNSRYDIDKLSRVKLVNQQIREAFPYGYVDELGKTVPFFIGKKEGFAFVTRSPVLISEPIAVSTLYIKDRDLLYCEVPLGVVSLSSFKIHESNCEKSISFMSSQSFEFQYFGWKDWLEFSNYYSEYLDIVVKPKPTWNDTFYASQRKIMPLFIRIKVKNDNARGKVNHLIYRISRIPPSLLGASSE
ncbi:prepilin-type N-terminal cleavage/methylation domain-containing protein [Pseudoalteromonas sp. S4498]|nr:prepilin-type N-terminal cleavage/methylation domain-containing protein [Pseudoalteromonas galatheae]RXE84535.1 hypothetical protein DRB05_21705 [Pseudoalteromonas sp. A757]